MSSGIFRSAFFFLLIVCMLAGVPSRFIALTLPFSVRGEGKLWSRGFVITECARLRARRKLLRCRECEQIYAETILQHACVFACCKQTQQLVTYHQPTSPPHNTIVHPVNIPYSDSIFPSRFLRGRAQPQSDHVRPEWLTSTTSTRTADAPPTQRSSPRK